MQLTKLAEDLEYEDDVNWGKAQWMQALDDPAMFILTTSEHRENEFSGTCLPCKDWKNGMYSDSWMKSEFTPLEEDLNIVIGN